MAFFIKRFVSWREETLRWIPGRTGGLLRRAYDQRNFAESGKGLGISEGCVFRGCGNIRIGREVSTGRF